MDFSTLIELLLNELPKSWCQWFVKVLSVLVVMAFLVGIGAYISRQVIEARIQDQKAQHESDVQALEDCKRDVAHALDDTRKAYQAKIDDLNSRLFSIDHRVGDKSVWDLSAVIVPPDQAKRYCQMLCTGWWRILSGY